MATIREVSGGLKTARPRRKPSAKTIPAEPKAEDGDNGKSVTAPEQVQMMVVSVAPDQTDADVMLANWQQTLQAMMVGSGTSDEDTMGMFFLSAQALREI